MQQAKLIEAARAHGELLQWQAFTDEVEKFEGDTRTVMVWLRDLFGMSLIERHLDWYLINGRLSGARAEAVTAYLDRLIGRIREHALDLVDAFELTPDLLRAEIATGIEAERQQEAHEYVEAQKAAGTWPLEEKQLRKEAKEAAKAAARAAKGD